MRALMVSLFFVGVCDDLQLVVVMGTAVLCSIVTAVYLVYSTIVFIWTTPRRGGLRFGTARLIRAEQAVPRGRPTVEDFKLSTGGGRQNNQSSWRPRHGKTNEAY